MRQHIVYYKTDLWQTAISAVTFRWCLALSASVRNNTGQRHGRQREPSGVCRSWFHVIRFKQQPPHNSGATSLANWSCVHIETGKKVSLTQPHDMSPMMAVNKWQMGKRGEKSHLVLLVIRQYQSLWQSLCYSYSNHNSIRLRYGVWALSATSSGHTSTQTGGFDF